VTAPSPEAIELARVEVVRLGEALDAASRPMHSHASCGAPKLRDRLEQRYVAALAELDRLLGLEDEAAAAQAKAAP